MVDLDPPLRQQLLHVSIGQAVAQVPTHSEHDDLGWEPKPHERRGHRKHLTGTPTTTHHPSLAAFGARR